MLPASKVPCPFLLLASAGRNEQQSTGRPAGKNRLDAARAGVTNPSQSAAGRVHAHLMVLTHVMYGLKQLDRAKAQQIYELLLEVSRISKPAVISAASASMYRLFSMHCDHILNATPRLEGPDMDGNLQQMGIPGSLNSAVARWVPRTCKECPRLTWATPAEDGVDAALGMMQALVQHIREELRSMKEAGQLADAHVSARMRLRRLQVFLGAGAGPRCLLRL